MFEGLSKSVATNKFKDFARKAGVNGMKLHSLGHTFATKLIDAGVDVLTVSKLLGHSDIKTTMIYAKTQFPVLQDAMGRLENARGWLQNGDIFLREEPRENL
jgi:site-specific recombinase XerD